MTISWIQRELARRFPTADLGKGVDLNGDGKIRGSERLTDANRNKQLGDPADWLAFYKKNQAQIVSLGGFFKWSKDLKPDNPIHDVLSLESDLATASQIEGAYAFIKATFKFKAIDAATTPLDRLKAAFERTHRFGFVYAFNDVHLLSAGVDKSRLDSDTMGFYILAIGHEKGWPVEMVDVPTHTYIRWKDHKSAPLNFDLGDVRTDNYYETHYNVSRSGVYPMVLDRNGLQAQIFFNRAVERVGGLDAAVVLNPHIRQKYLLALQDIDQAIALNPKEPAVHSARAVVLSRLYPEKSDEILRSCDKAIQLNPIQLNAHLLRAQILVERKMAPQALAELRPLLAYFPNDKLLHRVLAIVYQALGDLKNYQIHTLLAL